MRSAALSALLLLGSSCAQHVSPEQWGAQLAADPALTQSPYNRFSCLTCHAEQRGGATDPLLPGAPLAGSTQRPTFWGGAVLTVRDAVDVCLERFMHGAPLDPSAPQAQALYAYLRSLTPQDATLLGAQPFTVARAVSQPTGGDAARGAGLYQRACFSCHGAPHTGAGATYALDQPLPETTQNEHTAPMYTQADLETIFVQKLRQGSFLGFAGVMPPFSTERLSEQDAADLTAYLAPRLQPAH